MRTAAGVFHCLVPWRGSKYIGVLGAIIPLVIFMYYVVIEAWALGYTARFVRSLFDPALRFATIEDSQAFYASFVGARADGAAMQMSHDSLLPWLLLVFVINLVLIYRGISAGIEKVCRIGMPILMVLAVVVLVRVLTLGTPDPAKPDQNVSTGLGYMWNPGKTLVVDADYDTTVVVPAIDLGGVPLNVTSSGELTFDVGGTITGVFGVDLGTGEFFFDDTASGIDLTLLVDSADLAMSASLGGFAGVSLGATAEAQAWAAGQAPALTWRSKPASEG